MHPRCRWIVLTVACALAPPASGSGASPQTAPPGTSCFTARIAVQAAVTVRQVPLSGAAREVPEWSQAAWDQVHAALEGELGAVEHVYVDPAYPPPHTGLLVEEDEADDAIEPSVPP